MKGHNYNGICRKCGESHVNPLKGHNRNTVCLKCGRVHISGAKGICRSEETKKKISLARIGKPRSLETRLKISMSLTGKPSKLKGRKKSEEHKRKISKGLTGKQHSLLHRLHISLGLKRYWLAIRIVNVREFYNIPKSEVFFPSSLSDHRFSREVLIGKTKFYSYYEDNLRESLYYYDKNGEVQLVQGSFMPDLSKILQLAKETTKK